MAGTCGGAGQRPAFGNGVTLATVPASQRELTSKPMPRRTPRTPVESADLAALSNWAPELAETFVVLASDIALVLDGQGTIRKMAQHAGRPLLADADWVGRLWVDTASIDSRPKVRQILAEVASTGVARRREINHPQPAPAPSLALAYTAIRLGEEGPTLAVGHDLREQAAMQQRFLIAQQALEQSYWQSRQQEPTRPAVAANRPMSAGERAGFGLAAAHATAAGADAAVQSLLSALDGLRERIGHDALPGLLRDAKRLIEQHFLQRARERSGSDASLARSLGVTQRAQARRQALKQGSGATPGKHAKRAKSDRAG